MSKLYRGARKVCSSALVLGTSAALLALGLSPGPTRASEPAPAPDAAVLQRVLDDLRGALAIPHEVRVVLVAHNPLIASVRPAAGQPGVFVLSIEQGFLDGLPMQEIRAVLAHELGHVWIYTHHPFLQTEAFANHVAMRAVSRADIEQVYAKVWGAAAMNRDRSAFLGLAVAPGDAGAPSRSSSPPRSSATQQ